MKIISLRANWLPASPDGQFSDQSEDFKVGEQAVVLIEEHAAIGEGDKWFYDVHYESGRIDRIFNPNKVTFIP